MGVTYGELLLVADLVILVGGHSVVGHNGKHDDEVQDGKSKANGAAHNVLL